MFPKVATHSDLNDFSAPDLAMYEEKNVVLWKEKNIGENLGEKGESNP